MLYSVWRHELGLYDYYTVQPALGEIVTPKATHLQRNASSIGVAPEDAAWPLPDGAKRVGRGPLARGAVAVDQQALSALGDTDISGGGMFLLLLGAMIVITAVGCAFGVRD